MSDYIDETPLTDEEIAAAIAAARKAKAEKAKAKKAGLTKKEHPESDGAKSEKEGESESLFDEIDSASDSEEVLSPKMKSAKSFSNAFAAARSKREENLRKKKDEKKQVKQQEQEDLVPEQDFDVDSEEVEFEGDEYTEAEREQAYANESGADTAAEFDVDDEDEYYTADGEDSEQVEFDGIFQPDEEESPSYGTRVPVDEIEDEYDDDDDDEEYDEDEDDDDDSSVSTKTKVIVGIIIAVLVLAIVGVGAYFALNGGFGEKPEENVLSSISDVKSLSFADASISLRIGETAPLNIVIDPADAQDKVLRLKSGDTSIATVDSTGLVTGVSSGSTTITATLKSNETITASIIINVIDEKQNAINVYNKFINSILDGSTDIDSDDDTEEETDSDESSDSDSDSDTDSEKTTEPENILTGSIIRDLNDDGDLELALYYTSKDGGSEVRIFYLADENAEDSDDEYEEPQYDEYGNLIESSDEEESDTDTQSDSDTAVSEKILTEMDMYSEMYSVCYNAIEESESSWDTVYLEIKEGETGKARVTILSEDYKSPTVVYETSDDSVATVDNQGNVKAVGPGSCNITVTSPLNSEAMATVKIKVKDDTDLLDDYLAQIPIVNQTNDAVIPTETLTGKAIVDIDNDGISELLLRFDYGNDVQTINMVKIENDQCVVYKTYNNLSDLYEYYEGNGSYSNSVLIHYSTGKVCMEYKAVVAKEDSKTKTSEQKILSVEDSGSLSELVKFSTTTDVSTKTVTSEVFIDDSDDNTSSIDDVTSSDEDTWWGDDSDEDTDDTYYDSDDGDDDNWDDDDYLYPGYMTFSFDDTDKDTDLEGSRGIDYSVKKLAKTLPQKTGVPDDEPDNDDPDDDEPATSSRLTSTVTSEVTEETTKYFVNGTPVEQSVYEETLSTYSGRYAVWSDWESV